MTDAIYHTDAQLNAMAIKVLQKFPQDLNISETLVVLAKLTKMLATAIRFIEDNQEMLIAAGAPPVTIGDDGQPRVIG